MKTLLYNDTVKLANAKWSRMWSEGLIKIADTFYTLSATENKREFIRDCCGKLVGTRPHQLVDGVIMDRDPF
jgi:hypothetical protein